MDRKLPEYIGKLDKHPGKKGTGRSILYCFQEHKCHHHHQGVRVFINQTEKSSLKVKYGQFGLLLWIDEAVHLLLFLSLLIECKIRKKYKIGIGMQNRKKVPNENKGTIIDSY